jgi:hypothetical protein
MPELGCPGGPGVPVDSGRCTGNGPSIIAGVLKRGGNVSTGVEKPPDVDEVIALHVEHQVWLSANRQSSKAGETEFVREPQHSELPVLAGALSGSFDGIHEPQRNVLAGLVDVVVNRCFGIG